MVSATSVADKILLLTGTQCWHPAQPPSHTRASQCNLDCITFSNDPRSTCFNERTIATIFWNQNAWSFKSNPVKKQAGYSSDPTGFIKLVLLGHHAGTLAQAKVSQTRVRESKLPILNATWTLQKRKIAKITLQEAFPEPVQPVNIVSPLKI